MLQQTEATNKIKSKALNIQKLTWALDFLFFFSGLFIWEPMEAEMEKGER